MSDFESYRGQAGRNPALRFARLLRSQGFLPTQHFVERLRQRALALGVRFDPRTFRAEFLRGRHYRQTRPGYNTRIAVVRRIPILYRLGGWNGRQVLLVGVLPAGTLPPVTPVRRPSFESVQESAFPSSYEQHGPDYRKAQQVFLSTQVEPKKHRYPGFITGWISQERKRIKNQTQARKSGWKLSGSATTRKKLSFLRRILADPAQSEAAKKWARRQLQRLGAGQKRAKAMQRGEKVRPRAYYRVPPGYDTGHPIPHKPGVHDPTRFRLELARDNRSRPWKAKKLLQPRIGKRWKHYAESDFWLEEL